MSKRVPLYCSDAELAVDAACLESHIVGEERRVEPRAVADLMEAARSTLGRGRPCGIATVTEFALSELVALADLARSQGVYCAIAMLGSRELAPLGRELGLVVVGSLRGLLASIALAPERGAQPWLASARGLGTGDRARLRLSPGHRGAGRFVRGEGAILRYVPDAGGALSVGEARDVAEALDALRGASAGERLSPPRVEGVDTAAVLDVLFGPARALSDPASKAALTYFDIPLPLEELCASPTRAAAEAQRMGFPVRISLASPDLRLWEHPDLAIDGVESATRTRDVFRQIMSLARQRAPEERLLGVTVGASTTPQALLRVLLAPLPAGLVSCEITFADPHGRASADGIRTFLPQSREGVGRALDRLRGSALLFSRVGREAVVEEIGDVLMRLAAFVHAFRDEIVRVEIHPLAVLVGGEVEVREAQIDVSDVFERSAARGQA